MSKPTHDDQERCGNLQVLDQEPSSSALPPPPRPSADPGTISAIPSDQDEHANDHDALNVEFDQLNPLLALKLLCLVIERLVDVTGDVPPTPPITSPNIPNSSRPLPERLSRSSVKLVQDRLSTPHTSSHASTLHEEQEQHDVDAIPPQARTPIGSPEAHPTEPTHIIDPISIAPEPPISAEAQHKAITRKFYSKKPPPISFHEYLFRLHKYCPMSTAVYLATSVYIQRLALGSPYPQLPVTLRSAHRLLLAGLRVAMKTLEDQSYPARRFSKVGGVCEAELRRLEIAFCYVSNFDLRITREMLVEHVDQLREGLLVPLAGTTLTPRLPVLGNKRAMCLRNGQPRVVGSGQEVST